MSEFLEKNLEIILIIGLAILIGVAASFYFYLFDLVNANGDAIARLNISRRTIDSLSPGFAQLGYAWPPAQSILMMPLVWFDGLYHSGLAGVIPSLASFVLAAFFMYKIGSLLWGRVAGITSFVLFIANPNILYAQATPLSEIFYTATVLGMLYFLMLWAREHSEKFLAISGLFLFVATLSRYDGWFAAIFAIVVLAVYSLIKFSNWHKTESVVILFAAVTLFGPFLWLWWNYAIFENPLYFMSGEYSAQLQQKDLLENGLLPSYHNISNTLLHIYYSAKHVGGEVLVILGSIGFIWAAWYGIKEKKAEYVFLAVLLGQILYYVINLFLGNGVIFVPELFPYHLHNVRYAITFLPFFILGAAFLITRYKLVFPFVLALILFEYGAFASTGSIVTLNESVHGFAGRDAHESRINAGEWLGEHYDQGYLLADTFMNDSTIFYSKIPLYNWITEGTGDIYDEAVSDPSGTVEWIVMREADKIWKTFNESSAVAKNFRCAYRNEEIIIYKLNNGEAAASSSCEESGKKLALEN